MKYCKNCGHHISEKDKFCSECGERLDGANVPTKGTVHLVGGSGWEKASPYVKRISTVILIAAAFIGYWFIQKTSKQRPLRRQVANKVSPFRNVSNNNQNRTTLNSARAFLIDTTFIDKSMKSKAKEWMMESDKAVPKLKEDEILKNPGKYTAKGHRTYFKGKIIQIREKGIGGNCNGWFLLGRCKRSISHFGCLRWGDPIKITYRRCSGSPRKGKWVTVYGYVMGTYNYESVGRHLKHVAWIHAKYVAY